MSPSKTNRLDQRTEIQSVASECHGSDMLVGSLVLCVSLVGRRQQSPQSAEEAQSKSESYCAFEDYTIWKRKRLFSRGSQRASHGILNQLRATPYLQVLHHRIFVERNGARRKVQNKCNLLHRAALSQELQHFFLAQS